MTPSWPPNTVDFFREVYVENRQSKYLQLKFNPTIPASEYCIDFSSLAPFLLSGTKIRLRCGQSTLELRNCDEVWNRDCASEERGSIDLSNILPKEVPIHKPQQGLVYISPSSEAVPAIAKRRRESFEVWDSGELSQQAIRGSSTAFDISARPNKKRRVAAESAARKASYTTSNISAGGTCNTKQPSSLGTPNRGHPMGDNLAGNSSQSLNDSKIPETTRQRLIGSSIRKGKGRESDMNTGSGHMPSPTPYSYSAPTSSSHKPSLNSTRSTFAIQTHITDRTPSGIQPPAVIPSRHPQPLRHLPTYGALHERKEIPKTRSQYTGTSSVISGPQSTPATTRIELSESRNSLLGHGTQIGGSQMPHANAPYHSSRAIPSTTSQGSSWQALRRRNPALPSASYDTQAVPTSRTSSAEGKPGQSGVDTWNDANRWQASR